MNNILRIILILFCCWIYLVIIWLLLHCFISRVISISLYSLTKLIFYPLSLSAFCLILTLELPKQSVNFKVIYSSCLFLKNQECNTNWITLLWNTFMYISINLHHKSWFNFKYSLLVFACDFFDQFTNPFFFLVSFMLFSYV